jgi:5'-methylthioadenosine phosphorylase
MPSRSSSPSPVRIAIIGGSGIYEIEGMKVLRRFHPATPFGKPSDPITIGEFQGVACAFLPRHGKGHRFLPSEVPQRANFYALKLLGVELAVGLSACGSLKEHLRPRHFVIPDQVLDRTVGRPSTFFGQGIVAHISFAHPFSAAVSKALADAARAEGATVHEGGTYVCMEGPAFSTKAESAFHRQVGCDVIGMTAIPEAKLAREAEIAYAMAAMVTDYDCWKENEEAVSVQLVIENLMANSALAKKVVARLIPTLKDVPNDCANALAGAIFTSPQAIPPAAKRKLGPLVSKYLK